MLVVGTFSSSLVNVHSLLYMQGGMGRSLISSVAFAIICLSCMLFLKIKELFYRTDLGQAQLFSETLLGHEVSHPMMTFCPCN